LNLRGIFNPVSAGQQPLFLPSPFAPGDRYPPDIDIWGREGGRTRDGGGNWPVCERSYQFDGSIRPAEPRFLDGAVSGEHQRRSAERFEGRACLDGRPLLIDRLVTEPWNIYGLSLLLSRASFPLPFSLSPLPLRKSENWGLRDRSSSGCCSRSRGRESVTSMISFSCWILPARLATD